MNFMVTYTFMPQHRAAAVARFLETGAPAPKGATLIGRWHDANLHRGFAVFEAADVESAARVCHEWADLLTLEVVPVLDDAQLARVLAPAG